MKMCKEASTEPTSNIKATPALSDTLKDDELKRVDEIYASTCIQYNNLLQEYKKDKVRNKKVKKHKDFPTKGEWKPSLRILDDFERELVVGPQRNITILKRIEIREPGTGQWFTYGIKSYESSKRVISSYICVNHGIPDKEKPIFGRITKAFQHFFANKVTYFVLVDVYDTATLNTELNMWFVKLSITEKAIFQLDDVSYPLVVAEDETKSLLWFLKYP